MPIDLLLPDKHGVSQAHAMFISQSQFHREKNLKKSKNLSCILFRVMLLLVSCPKDTRR